MTLVTNNLKFCYIFPKIVTTDCSIMYDYQSNLKFLAKTLLVSTIKSLLHGWRKLVQGLVENCFITAEKWD